jgi:hypothetical protein
MNTHEWDSDSCFNNVSTIVHNSLHRLPDEIECIILSPTTAARQVVNVDPNLLSESWQYSQEILIDSHDHLLIALCR